MARDLGVVAQPGTAGPDTFAMGDWGNHLRVSAARDPATRLGWFRVVQFPDEATGEAKAGQIMIEFMVWRGAETTRVGLVLGNGAGAGCG